VRRGTYALLAALLAAPAGLLGVLAWRSVEREASWRRRTAEAAARDEAGAALAREAARLEDLRRREDARPYFQYQSRYMPAGISANAPAFVASPLSQVQTESAGDRDAGDDADGVRGWVQWTLARERVIGPETFRFDAPASADAVASWRGTLEERLKVAPDDAELRARPPLLVPVRVVAANEEVGQLLEEIDVARKNAGQTLYLDNFSERVQSESGDEPVMGVRATPFRWLARSGVAEPLVAWRLVWVPAREAKERRDAPTDRWIVQAFAPRLGLPTGAVWLGEPDRNAAAVRDARGARDVVVSLDLAAAIDAERPWGPVPELMVAGVVHTERIDAESEAARTRLRIVLLGLACVVGVGLYALGRSMRRERDLARRREDFVAAVTHELKTPLTGIRMYADMLREGWLPEGAEVADYAGRIGAEADRLGRLVDQVLDLAALDRGVATVDVRAGDLGDAVRAAVALMEPVAREAGVPLATDVEAGLPAVRFDAGFVRGIVLNLVDNAVKYGGKGEGKGVRVLARRAPGGVALVVADRGPGIPPEVRARLFEPFARGGREETRTARGVGLGLALVRRYADAQGATVEVDSAADRGTAVTVVFPM